MLPPLELSPEVATYIQQSLFNEKFTEEFGEEICAKYFTELLNFLSKPPCFTTLRVNTLRNSTGQIREKVIKLLEKQYTSKDWPVVDVYIHPVLPDLLIIPSSGPQDIKPVESEVIVDVLCGMSLLRGADVYVQGIMVLSPGVARGTEVSVYVDIDKGCRKGLIQAYTGRKVFVGNGIAVCNRQDVFCVKDKSSGIGIRMTKPLFVAPSLSGLLQDLIYPQNLPSVVCGHVLDIKPGQLVLDMCAAPGGKTTHLATLMKNKGRLIALDKNKKKVERIVESCKLWQITCVEVYDFDATRCLDEGADLQGAPPYPSNSFDRILLDAPCSGLGQRPSLKNYMTLNQVRSYPPLQRKLFSKAVQLLAPGGILVYSTCTIPVEENENIVAWALKQHPNLSLSEQVPYLGRRGWPVDGLSQAQSQMLQRFGLAADTVSCDNTQSDWQRVDTDCIGFFLAKFVKNKD